MAYKAKNFDSLLGTDGFSETLLQNHFKLYQGYVTNTNKVADELESLLKDKNTGSPAYGEISRRFGWEFNGMRLHEYYFGNMVKGGASFDKNSELYKSRTTSAASMHGKRTSKAREECAESDGSFSTMTAWARDYSMSG